MAIKIGGTTIIDDSRVLINTGNVGVGTTNPNSVVSGSNTSIVHAGIVTARELYGDGSNLTDIEFATTAGIATYTSEWILETGNGSDYGISGPGLTGTENDPTFYLTRGEQYKFINNTGGHPFRIQSTPNGSVGTQYSDGITNNNAGNGTTLLWNVQFDSPDILYYQCITGGHGGMGGKIYIVNAGIASDVNLLTTGISTLGGVKIASGIITATSGIVTYYGDGQYLQNISSGGGGGGGDTYQFNTGITSSFSAVLTGIGNTILSLPSTAGKQYIVYSIHASNVAAGNTEVNVTGSFDFNGGERSYFAYSLPIPTGVGLELLVEPQILNPSDQILMRGLDYNRNGTDDIVEVYVTYQEKTSDEYISVGLGTIGIDFTDPIGIYTSSSYPSVIQSIRLINRTDSGAYPISVSVANGVNTIRLVNNLIVPKYASVEILETPKRLNLNDVLNVQVNQTETIDVQISGQQIR